MAPWDAVIHGQRPEESSKARRQQFVNDLAVERILISEMEARCAT